MVDHHRLIKVAAAGLIASMLLASCQTTWRKPGAGQAEFNVDSYACERDASRAQYGGDLSAAAARGHLYLDCMAAHGWAPDALIDLR